MKGGASMADERSVEDLFRAFQRGDRAAFKKLAHCVEPSMLGLARGLLAGDSARACDAVQNAWIRVIRSASAFKGDSSVKTWVYRIVVNECRRMRVTMKHGTEPIEDALHAARGADPANATAVVAEERARIRAAVEQLPCSTREAVLLCFHHGLTHAQAAAVLEVPLGTLKTRVRAALNELRAALSMEVSR
jgi:RNA polymerase sigma-70 factor (ECF subfamily)